MPKSKPKPPAAPKAPDPLAEAAKIITEATGASPAEAKAQASKALAAMVAQAAIRGGIETGTAS